MKFCQEELEIAQLLKDRGLAWTPAPGHYVLDQSDLIERESPFQHRVFFILDLQHFLRRAGSLAHLKERVCWLPTWEQARRLLRQYGVTDQSQARHVRDSAAMEQGAERVELYRLLAQQFREVC